MENGILFVCLGNICRSPTAAAVARDEFARLGLDIPVASCGTGDWHVGQGADPRTLRAGAAAGYDLSSHRARQLQADDFARYRWILTMDRANLRDVRARCPQALQERVGLFLAVAGITTPSEVPDPYHGNTQDFADVVTLIRHGVLALAQRL